MFYSQSLALIGGVVVLAVAPAIYTQAFITTTIISSPSRFAHSSPLCASMPDNDGAVSESRRNFGFVAALALLFPTAANAVEIVTMDMSMPGR